MVSIKKIRAFTLIELLVVVAIIGILAAVGVVAYNGYTANAKKKAVLTNHNSIVKDLSARMHWCELGNNYYTYTDYSGSGGYIDCSYSTWSLTGRMASYYKTFFRNPYGALNGSWDYSTYFVDRTKIPTSCSATQLGYTFLTSFDTPRAYFKVGTCYELNKAPKINEVDRYQ